ncbi:MAG: hypothetical protein JO130_14880, partial [Solirubrobacterales bacterium]|nr:hypothetical protein [Solirubrobacterales bacterium]
MERRPTRRELMVGAVGAAGVGAALAPDASLADTPAPSDAQLLTDSLAVERVMVLAYRRVLASGLLTPDV